jgi:hypothetical protein
MQNGTGGRSRRKQAAVAAKRQPPAAPDRRYGLTPRTSRGPLSKDSIDFRADLRQLLNRTKSKQNGRSHRLLPLDLAVLIYQSKKHNTDTTFRGIRGGFDLSVWRFCTRTNVVMQNDVRLVVRRSRDRVSSGLRMAVRGGDQISTRFFVTDGELGAKKRRRGHVKEVEMVVQGGLVAPHVKGAFREVGERGQTGRPWN